MKVVVICLTFLFVDSVFSRAVTDVTSAKTAAHASLPNPAESQLKGRSEFIEAANVQGTGPNPKTNGEAVAQSASNQAQGPAANTQVNATITEDGSKTTTPGVDTNNQVLKCQAGTLAKGSQSGENSHVGDEASSKAMAGNSSTAGNAVTLSPISLGQSGIKTIKTQISKETTRAGATTNTNDIALSSNKAETATKVEGKANSGANGQVNAPEQSSRNTTNEILQAVAEVTPIGSGISIPNAKGDTGKSTSDITKNQSSEAAIRAVVPNKEQVQSPNRQNTTIPGTTLKLVKGKVGGLANSGNNTQAKTAGQSENAQSDSNSQDTSKVETGKSNKGEKAEANKSVSKQSILATSQPGVSNNMEGPGHIEQENNEEGVAIIIAEDNFKVQTNGSSKAEANSKGKTKSDQLRSKPQANAGSSSQVETGQLNSGEKAKANAKGVASKSGSKQSKEASSQLKESNIVGGPAHTEQENNEAGIATIVVAETSKVQTNGSSKAEVNSKRQAKSDQLGSKLQATVGSSSKVEAGKSNSREEASADAKAGDSKSGSKQSKEASSQPRVSNNVGGPSQTEQTNNEAGIVIVVADENFKVQTNGSSKAEVNSKGQAKSDQLGSKSQAVVGSTSKVETGKSNSGVKSNADTKAEASKSGSKQSKDASSQPRVPNNIGGPGQTEQTNNEVGVAIVVSAENFKVQTNGSRKAEVNSKGQVLSDQLGSKLQAAVGSSSKVDTGKSNSGVKSNADVKAGASKSGSKQSKEAPSQPRVANNVGGPGHTEQTNNEVGVAIVVADENFEV